MWEDEHLLVIDKPAGLVVHPGAGHASGTLVDALAGKIAGGEPGRPGIVHRLDRDTSGLMVVARSQEAYDLLTGLVREHALERTYTALVKGRPRSRTGRIEAPIGRDRGDATRISLDSESAREAVTHFEVVELWPEHALLRVTLETGRMHQIRVHLQAVDLPVVGDPTYGVSEPLLGRQFLHASELAFPHPVSGRAHRDPVGAAAGPRCLPRPARLSSTDGGYYAVVQCSLDRWEHLGGRWPELIRLPPRPRRSTATHKPQKGAPMPVVSMKELLESGVHFGHQTRRWNPKMKRFIFTERGGIYIIDLTQTQELLDEAYNFAKAIAERGGSVLFVGTKKQAQDAVRDEARRVGMPYVNNRWLGGLLTNWRTISDRIQRLHELRALKTEAQLDLLPAKERISMEAELEKLESNLGGVADMRRQPDAIFIVDLRKEQLAVREAKRLNLPVIALVDTNCDPDEADYVIPGNDDAIRSCHLVIKALADGIEAGKRKVTSAELQNAKNERAEAEAAAAAEAEPAAAEAPSRRPAAEAAARQRPTSPCARSPCGRGAGSRVAAEAATTTEETAE